MIERFCLKMSFRYGIIDTTVREHTSEFVNKASKVIKSLTVTRESRSHFTFSLSLSLSIAMMSLERVTPVHELIKFAFNFTWKISKR